MNLFLAGQGSGKTHVAGIVSAILINNFPKVHGFIGANTYSQLSDSTLFRIRSVWKEFFGWTEYSKKNPYGIYTIDIEPPSSFNTEGHEYDSYHGKICFRWGTVIYKGSLDNYKAHDGKEFGWAILDETKDTKEEAVKEVILGRLREPGMWVDSNGRLIDNMDKKTGKLVDSPEGNPFNPLYIFTSPAKVQWINEWFKFDDFANDIVASIYSEVTYFKKNIGNKLAVISSTYHNKQNLPANYIDNQMQNLPSHLQDMLIYANPFSQSGGEFYKCFNRNKNVINVCSVVGFENDGKHPYNPNLPIHLSFDFNVNPHMTATVWQIDGKKAYQIDEICLSNPRNTTVETCKEFTRRYNDHAAGLFIYGDKNGENSDTRSEKGSNDFIIILRELRRFNPSKRVQNLNPSVTMRGNFMNTIFEKGYNGIEIWIHENCSKSIADFLYLKEASDGSKLKEKVTNPDTKVSYEKYGHTSDTADYIITFAFISEFIRFQKMGVGGDVKTGKPASSKNAY